MATETGALAAIAKTKPSSSRGLDYLVFQWCGHELNDVTIPA